MSALTQSAPWRALQQHVRELKEVRTLDFFAADGARGESFSAEAAGVYLDYSKQRVTRETLDLLFELARHQHLEEWIARLFAGEAVNHTENRAALHLALRAAPTAEVRLDGENIVPSVQAVLTRLLSFAEAVRSGSWKGQTRAKITDVVNIGIGGSDLGPRMVCTALKLEADGPRTHFVANADGAQLHGVLSALKPQSTLFIITSKTFTTQETMANAAAAREWLVAALGEKAVARHFVAVSTNQAAVEHFGIAPDNMFGFWDWVGGRYSMWSAVGLAIAIALGAERFQQFLKGAREMDAHFRHAPMEGNLPVLMGLLGVWNNNFLHCASQVVAPYAQGLEQFVAWLQQLEMESNGKGVSRDGEPLDYAATPVIWGDVGTNSQHAFFQMLHQGTRVHPVDFILIREAQHPYEHLNRLLLANGLAQSAALMRGKSNAEVRAELTAKGLSGTALEAAVPHREFSGNRPSNTLVLSSLDAEHLGALCALYEHRCFVQSVLWNINAFDQWGVELGKQLAQEVLKGFDGDDVRLDGSTQALLRRLR